MLYVLKDAGMARVNQKKPALTRVQIPTPAMFFWLVTLTLTFWSPKIRFRDSLWNISLSSMMILAGSFFEISCGKTDETHRRRMVNKPPTLQLLSAWVSSDFHTFAPATHTFAPWGPGAIPPYPFTSLLPPNFLLYLLLFPISLSCSIYFLAFPSLPILPE